MKVDEFPYNRTQIKKIVPVLAIGIPVTDNKTYQKTMPLVKKFLRQKVSFNNCFFLDRENIKHKLLLLDYEKLDKNELPSFLSKLDSHNILYLYPENSAKDLTDSFAKAFECRAVSLSDVTKPGPYRVTLNYENLDFDETLRLLLPEIILPISSFSVMGNLVHFNLNENALPFKETIGHVALDKIPNVKTIVNKAATINTEFRTFKLDLLAGEENFVTMIKENEFTYHFDFSKVYWNSRLGTEHSRIVDEIHKEILKNGHYRPVIFDACCGIGPFSIPLAKLKFVDHVYANDLNPDSVFWLKKNIEANSTRKRPIVNLDVFNLDARQFLREMILQKAILYKDKYRENGQKVVFYIIMNLPATAIEFLDVFPSLSEEIPEEHETFFKENDFHVRCYTFVRDTQTTDASMVDTPLSDIEESLKEKCCSIMCLTKETMNGPVRKFSTQFVRNVAPFKDMHRINLTINMWNMRLAKYSGSSNEDLSSPPLIKKAKQNEE